MKIEITMATIGRLMKNFDMAGYLFSACRAGFASGLAAAFGWRRTGVNGLRVHHDVRLDFLDPLGNHAFTRFQPLTDNPVGADPLADLHQAHINLVVASHHRHQVFPLDIAHRPLRNQERPFLTAINARIRP